MDGDAAAYRACICGTDGSRVRCRFHSSNFCRDPETVSYLHIERVRHTWVKVTIFSAGQCRGSLPQRFAIPHEPDYSRFRNKLRISRPGQTAPYVGVELLIDASGFRSVRYSVRL